MSWLLKLYPREWRRHYGSEMAEVVASQPGSLQLAIDLLGGAIDAHLKPQLFARRLADAKSESAGGPDMTGRLMGCRSRAEVSRKDALIAAAMTLGAALMLAALLMLIDDRTAKSILIVMSPGVYVIGAQWLYLRGHSPAARIGLIGGPMVILFLIGLVTALGEQRGG